MTIIRRRDFVRADGTPWAYESVLIHVSLRIGEASKRGVGLRLSAEEVRALDWAVIRSSGGLDTTSWREITPEDLSVKDV